MPTKNFFMDSIDWQDFAQRTLRYLHVTCNPLFGTPVGGTGAPAAGISSSSLPALDLHIDGLELVGPGGASKVLHRFDSKEDLWVGNTSFSSDRAPRGLSRGSMVIHCARRSTSITVRPRTAKPALGFRFNISEYTHLRYRWKASNVDAINMTCGCATCSLPTSPRAPKEVIGCDGYDGIGYDYLDIGVPVAIETQPPWAPYNDTAATDGGYCLHHVCCRSDFERMTENMPARVLETGYEM
eukprot:SAG25_NODE_154_length_13563_cov_44.588978_15_plen_241_part_00